MLAAACWSFPAKSISAGRAPEAQSRVIPVIVFGRGGAPETVAEGETGLFFEKKPVEALRDALEPATAAPWDGALIRADALRFDRSAFADKIYNCVTTHLAAVGSSR